MNDRLSRRGLLGRLSAVIGGVLAAPLAPNAAAQSSDPRFFTQTSFRVDNDAFWDFFQHRGMVRFAHHAGQHLAEPAATSRNAFVVEIGFQIIRQRSSRGVAQVARFLQAPQAEVRHFASWWR